MNDQNKKTLRQFQCRDYLWEIFEQMSQELECSVDYLVNEAMRQYARSRNYGGRTPGGPEPTGPANVRRDSSSGGMPAIQAAPQVAPQAVGGPGRPRIPSQPMIPSAPPGPPAPRPQYPSSGYGASPPASNPGYPAPPAPRSSPGGYPAPPAPGGGYPAPPSNPGYPQQGYGGQQGGGQQGGYPAPPPAQSPYGGGGYPAPPPSNPAYAAPQAPRPAAPSSYPPPPTQRPPAYPGAQPPPLRPSAPGGGMSAPTAPDGGMPSLFCIFNGQKYPVAKEEWIIGRGNKTADLPIKDGNISRRHAAVILQNGGFYMKDLGSTNGIEFQGRRVDTKRIEEGDIYQICDYELRFTYR